MTNELKIIRIPYYLKLFGLHIPTLNGLKIAKKLLLKTRPNIILCWPLQSPLAIVVSSIQKLLGGRVAGSILTGAPFAPSTGIYSLASLSSLMKYILAKFVLKRYIQRFCDIIFAISDGIREILQEYFGIESKRIRIMRLGADPELFSFNEKERNETRKKLGISDKEIVIVYSGRITPDKEIPLLLDAYAELADCFPQSKILLIGGGQNVYLAEIRRMVGSLGIANRIIFHDFVPSIDLSKFYSASDIAIWPGSPSISIVEAASARLPLIIVKSPFTSYTVANENGFSFLSGNKEQLIALIQLLLENPTLRNNMAKKSRELVELHLNWRIIAKKAIRDILEVN